MKKGAEDLMKYSKSYLETNSEKKILSINGVSLLVLTVVVCIFSLVMLYSASNYTAMNTYGDSFKYVKKQGVALAFGLAFMVVFIFVKRKYIIKASIPLLVLSYLLLAIIFIPGVGVEAYGARRWINLGITTIQPSEVAKFGLIIFSSDILSRNGADKLKGFLPVFIVGLSMCLLLILEPNMSVTVLTALLMLFMLFIGGAKGKMFLFLVIPMFVGGILLIVLEPYRMQRLFAFIDPWASPKGEGYQLIQSYYALGSGGWFGVGLFNSRQKHMFLPFAESDFVFSIIGEELGFIGGIVVLLMLLGLSFIGFSIARNAKNRFDSLLAYGISSVICLQTLINVAVVSGSIPPTGIPLPFISYGGSSLICFTSSIGLLLSIDRNGRRDI